MIRRVIVSLVASLICRAAFAQMDPMFTKGFDPTKTYDLRAIDSVNMFNGNLVASVPLTQTFRVSPTLSYGWTAVYNSHAWDAHPISNGIPQSCIVIDPEYQDLNDLGVQCTYEQALTTMLPCRRCNAGMGWVVSMGRLVPPEDPTNEMTASDRGFLYEGPDGREHPFSSVGANAEPPYTTYSTDESRLRLRATAIERIIDFPDGTTQVFEKEGTDDNEPWRLIDYYDRFENHVYIHYDFTTEATTGNTLEVWTVREVPNGYTVTAPLRTHTLNFTYTPAGSDRTNHAGVLGTTWSQSRLTSITTTAFGGQTATVSLGYTRTAVPRHPSDTMGSGGVPGYAPNQFLLTSVTLPDPNETYAMPLSSSYQLCNGVNGYCVDTGLLRSLTLPTKGKINWTYEEATPPVPVSQTPPVPNEPGPQFPVQIINAAVATRTTDDGTPTATWYYDYRPLKETCYTESNTKEWWHFRQLASGVTAPDGTTTMSYYSIYRSFDPCDDEGWSQSEYGLPFTHHVSVRKDPNNPNDTSRLVLSTEVYSNTPPSASPWFTTATAANAGFGQATGDAMRLQPPGGTLRRQTYVEFSYLTFAGGSAYIPDQERTYDTSTHFTETVRSNADSYGHFRQKSVGGNLGTPLYRTSFTNYLVPTGFPTTSTSWLFDTYSEQCALSESSVHSTVSDCAALGSGATTATFSLQKFCFDASTGFLSRRRAVRGTSPANGDFLAMFSPSSTGEVATESYFGGDDDSGTAVDFGQGDVCEASYTPKYKINHTYTAGTLATSQYDASDFYTVDRDIDVRTGLVSTARDTAGNGTVYSYDTSGRLTTITPPTGAGTAIAYHSGATPPNVEMTRGSGTTAMDEVTYFDGLGRVKQSRKQMPAGWSTTSTTYDSATGNVSSVTMPLFGTSKTYSALAGNVTVYAYDFLGRLTSTALPDGTSTTTQYTGVESAVHTQQIGTTLASDGSVSMTPETTTETYDPLGRLGSVKEKSDGDVTTTYNYDVADRLIKASTTGSGATQDRTFTYDGAGNLTAEKHPELDSSGKTYSNIDARGHVRTTTTGTGTALVAHIAFDSKERITSLTDGSNNVLKAFDYGRPSDGNANGRLKTATRHNRLASGTDMIVAETYAYDAAGRVSDRDTSVSAGTTSVQTFHQHFAYDTLGDTTTITYPQANSFTGSPAINDLTQRFTNGFLVAVPGYAGTTTADGISYSAHGLVQTVAHGDGLLTKDTYSVDSSNLPRFGAIELATPCDAPSATMTAPASVCPNSSGNVASVPSGSELTYAWTISGGTITAGAATSSVTFTAGASGAVTLGVTVSKNGCTSSSSKVITNSAPVANVSGSSTVASGSSTTVFATLTGAPPWNLVWSDGHVQNNVLSSPTSYTLTPTSSTTMTVQSIGDANCATGSVTGPGWTITVGTLPDAPSSVDASATSAATSVHVRWALASGATSYDVLRASTRHDDVAGVYTTVATQLSSNTTSIDDWSVASSHSYIYRVRAVNAVGTRLSNFDVATTVPFHDHATVTATDLTDLRTAVIAMQTVADIQPPITFPNDIYVGAPILLTHLSSLRNALDDARRNLGLPAIGYAEPTASLAQRVTTIKVQQVVELRGGVQ